MTTNPPADPQGRFVALEVRLPNQEAWVPVTAMSRTPGAGPVPVRADTIEDAISWWARNTSFLTSQRDMAVRLVDQDGVMVAGMEPMIGWVKFHPSEAVAETLVSDPAQARVEDLAASRAADHATAAEFDAVAHRTQPGKYLVYNRHTLRSMPLSRVRAVARIWDITDADTLGPTMLRHAVEQHPNNTSPVPHPLITVPVPVSGDWKDES